MIEMDDPFANFPELIRERQKLERQKKLEEQGITGRGGLRPKAGRPPGTKKTLRFSILINKTDEEEVVKQFNELKDKYGQ